MYEDLVKEMEDIEKDIEQRTKVLGKSLRKGLGRKINAEDNEVFKKTGLNSVDYKELMEQMEKSNGKKSKKN